MHRHETRRFGRFRWGIAQLLVLLLVVALAPLVLLQIIRGVEDVRDSRASVTNRALGQAEEEAETMTEFVRFTERYISTIAADPAVRSMDRPRIDQLFREVRSLNANYVNIFLVSPDGQQLASTEPAISDPDIGQQPYFRGALQSNSMTISGALAWRDTERSVVVLARRVVNGDGGDGEIVGVVCIALNVARLSTVIGFAPLPPGSVVLLMQWDGTVIAANESPESWVGESLAGIEPLKRAWAKGSGTTTIQMPDGVDRVVGFQPVYSAQWMLIAGIPQAEVNAVFRESLLHIAEQTLLVAVATALLAWIVLRRVVVPIHMLADGARAFAAGFLNRRIPLHRQDELGDLAASLNGMAESLSRRLEEEEEHARALRELHQLQTEFVATASHELRTPVTAIRTYAEALMRPDIIDAETRRECLEGIDRASERLTRLVRTLLDVSRIDSGQVPVALESVDVGHVLRAAAQAGGARVSVDVPHDLPPVAADPDRLEDAIANLVANARKFSGPSAPITVRAAARGDAIEMAVADRGPGIQPSELTRIFDRFYQVQRGPQRQAGGAGLGLYIARGYITAMGGRIWATSTPGEGAVFHISLPRADRPPTEETTDAPIAGVVAGG